MTLMTLPCAVSIEQAQMIIRPIAPEDSAAVAAIIRRVMPEFGADGAGFAIHDAEVDTMFEAYSHECCAYFVIEVEGRVVGGAGIAPLKNAEDSICELQKMYVLPEGRGFGAGKRLLEICLETAEALGFSQCYVETLASMEAARRLYEKFGFVSLAQAVGDTGHHGCNAWYMKPLRYE